MKNVLVIEDTPLFQAVIQSALDDLPFKTRAIRFATGSAAISYCLKAAVGPDLALVDLGLPDMSGVQVIERLREIYPDMPVLVISVFSSERKVVDAIRAGAMGYVLKGDDDIQLSRAIVQVLCGQFPISPVVARYLFELASGSAAGRPPGPEGQADEMDGLPRLSPQEMALLEHIASGMCYRDAAESMGLKLSTVLSYSRNLFRKLEVHSKTQALLRARQRGLIA